MKERPELYLLEKVALAMNGQRLIDIDSLVIGEGGVCCLAGPNGSGKTLFLSLLAGLYRPGQGIIKYRGKDLGEEVGRGAMGREITMVHQQPFLFGGTVLANVVYGMRTGSLTRREREKKGETLLERVGLQGLGRRRAGRLSAGERTRVALARALGCGARTLLLDEPTASIDRDGVSLVEEIIIDEAGRAGRTVVMSTHSMAQAERLGGTMFRVRDGRVTRGEAKSPTGAREALPGSTVRVRVPNGDISTTPPDYGGDT